MITYVTENSAYTIDPEAMQYLREPRDGEEQVVNSHRLTYDVWHPLKSLPVILEDGTLHIVREDSHIGIFTSRVLDTLTD